MVKKTSKKAPQKSSSISNYVILESRMSGGMLLSPIKHTTPGENWTIGEKFRQPPAIPVVVRIRDGYEEAELRSFLSVPPILSKKLYEILVKAGVDNLEVFDAVLTSRDGKVAIEGFKAFNLVGLFSMADLKKSKFSPGNSSREIDASFDKLVFDPNKKPSHLMFRLEEYTSAVVVHKSIRQAIEEAGITHIKFIEASEFIS